MSRIGVFICWCGENIARTVDVAKVAEASGALPGTLMRAGRDTVDSRAGPKWSEWTAMPGALTTWQTIGGNVQGITANINTITKPKWYDRLIGYVLGLSHMLNIVFFTALAASGIPTARLAQMAAAQSQ